MPHLFHDWSDWNIIEKGKVCDHCQNWTNQIGTYMVLSKFCHKCGDTKIKRRSTVYLNPGNYKLVPDQITTSPKHDAVVNKGN